MKATDRICCRHFKDEDIDRYWIHTINGVEEKLERERPVLKKNTVPSKNLSLEYEKLKKSKKESDSAKHHKKELEVVKAIKRGNNICSISLIESEDHDVEVLVPTNEENITEHDTKTTCSDQNVLKQKEAFETLYDEIFDVTLPSPLWGIHRGYPDGTFVVFSKISFDKISLDRAVRINDNWEYTIQINGVLVGGDTLLKNLDPETIAELLDRVDQIE